MKTVAIGVAFAAALLGSGAAYANGTGGHSALSLAELVGLRSPLLSAPHKDILFKFLNGDTTFASSNAPFTFTASLIDCGAGDVDITASRCTLAFGSAPQVQLSAAAAHELYATLIEAGVPSDGAAGTIHESVTNLSCTVDVGQVKQRAGGGATCTFTPN
jgi:hypothetical protein